MPAAYAPEVQSSDETRRATPSAFLAIQHTGRQKACNLSCQTDSIANGQVRHNMLEQRVPSETAFASGMWQSDCSCKAEAWCLEAAEPLYGSRVTGAQVHIGGNQSLSHYQLCRAP